ncbi:MAG: T9SS type A sorting domain-containing protein [bacterium]|nr:T9SS type A sorting domain-containing protein [bacterium]
MILIVLSLFAFSIASAQQIYQVNVSTSWQSTGITIPANSTIVIEGKGIFRVNSDVQNSNVWYGPDGNTLPSSLGNGIVPSIADFALVGRISTSGTPFRIGSYHKIRSSQSGTLYVSINDYTGGSNFTDNSGSLIVVVTTAANLTSGDNVGVAEPGSSELPQMVDIGNNYPNPFNPTTTISYSMPKRGNVEVNVFDLQGRLVRNLLQAEQMPGEHQVMWDSRNDVGAPVSSGTYFYQVRVDGVSGTKQMILLK